MMTGFVGKYIRPVTMSLMQPISSILYGTKKCSGLFDAEDAEIVIPKNRIMLKYDSPFRSSLAPMQNRLSELLVLEKSKIFIPS